MYVLVSSAVQPDPVMYQCPLCYALVREIKSHTAYHESRGENDEG